MGNEFVGTGNGKLYQELMGANGLLRSISDEINANAFNATQQYTGNYEDNQAIIANKDSIEIMKIEAEEKKKEDEALEVLADAAREEAWDNSIHNVAGMELSGAEIDGIIETIKDPNRRAEIIARRAKDKNISPQEAEQQLNMTLAYLEAKKRIDSGQGTDADRALVDSIEQDPEKIKIVRDNVQLIQKYNSAINQTNEALVSNGSTDLNSMQASANILSAGISPTVSGQDGHSISAAAITPNFNTQSGARVREQSSEISATVEQTKTAQMNEQTQPKSTLGGAPSCSAVM